MTIGKQRPRRVGRLEPNGCRALATAFPRPSRPTNRRSSADSHPPGRRSEPIGQGSGGLGGVAESGAQAVRSLAGMDTGRRVRTDRIPAANGGRRDARRSIGADRGVAAHDAPPRPGRGRHLGRRRRRHRVPPAVDHRHRPLAPAAALPRRPLPPDLQRRGLQLPRTARAPHPRLRRRVRDRGRRRGGRRRLPLPGREGAARAARHVLVPDLGLARAGHVRRPRLVRDQAALHLFRRARALLRQREEGPAVDRRAWPPTPTSTRTRCSTT